MTRINLSEETLEEQFEKIGNISILLKYLKNEEGTDQGLKQLREDLKELKKFRIKFSKGLDTYTFDDKPIDIMLRDIIYNLNDKIEEEEGINLTWTPTSKPGGRRCKSRKTKKSKKCKRRKTNRRK